MLRTCWFGISWSIHHHRSCAKWTPRQRLRAQCFLSRLANDVIETLCTEKLGSVTVLNNDNIIIATIYNWKIHATLAYMDAFRNLPLNSWQFCHLFWLMNSTGVGDGTTSKHDCFPCAKMIKFENVLDWVETCRKHYLYLQKGGCCAVGIAPSLRW